MALSLFLISLGIALNMQLYFTLEYHLEANGQVEHTNQTLEQYFQVYYNY